MATRYLRPRPTTQARIASTRSAGVNKSDAGYSKAAWRRTRGGTGRKTATPEQPLMKALRAEHRHIATVMQLFSEQLKSIEQGQPVDTHVVYEVMDYMVTWPDRYHHPREDLIYGRVAEIDSKSADDVDTLQRDHDQTAKRGRKVTLAKWPSPSWIQCSISNAGAMVTSRALWWSRAAGPTSMTCTGI